MSCVYCCRRWSSVSSPVSPPTLSVYIQVVRERRVSRKYPHSLIKRMLIYLLLCLSPYLSFTLCIYVSIPLSLPISSCLPVSLPVALILDFLLQFILRPLPTVSLLFSVLFWLHSFTFCTSGLPRRCDIPRGTTCHFREYNKERRYKL